MTLAEARQKALDNSRIVLLSRDPSGRGFPTFGEATELTIEIHRNSREAGSTLGEQWASTFRLHSALMMDKPVDRTDRGDVLRRLAPIWNSKPAAAGKAPNRIAAVFRWCVGQNHRLDNLMDRALAALPQVSGAGPEHYCALEGVRAEGCEVDDSSFQDDGGPQVCRAAQRRRARRAAVAA